MITVGFVKEAYFIARVLNDVFYFKIFPGEKADRELCIKVTPDATLDVYYQGHHIWNEKIEGDTAFFGVESCDTISRVIACIDNGSPWEDYRYIETP